MKTAVVSLQFGERDYFAVSRAALERFCFFHGYALTIDPGASFADGRDRRWSKVGAMLDALATADRVLYLDGDALPVNPTRSLSELDGLLGGASMLVGEDSPGHANTGVVLALRSAVDVLEHWCSVPDHHPETRRTWPVDELGFNSYTLPAFRSRIATCRGAGSDADFLRGSFFHHFCNGTQSRKAESLQKLVATWPQS
jgi:hypothetical protein